MIGDGNVPQARVYARRIVLRQPLNLLSIVAMSPFSTVPESRLLPAARIGEATDRDLEAWGLMPLLDYWNQARGNAFAPRWADFRIIDLPRDVRGGLVVVDHDPARNDFYIRFWGVDLRDVFGIDITGAWLSEMEHLGVMTQFLEHGVEILRTKAPQKVIHQAQKATGETETYPVLRLPISDDGVRVTKIITCRNAQRLGRRRFETGVPGPAVG
jgi:hypothetical protein